MSVLLMEALVLFLEVETFMGSSWPLGGTTASRPETHGRHHILRAAKIPCQCFPRNLQYWPPTNEDDDPWRRPGRIVLAQAESRNWAVRPSIQLLRDGSMLHGIV